MVDALFCTTVAVDNASAVPGTCFLQEYMIPRNSKSLCVYDTRGLSTIPSENLKLLQQWMTRGVRHGAMDFWYEYL